MKNHFLKEEYIERQKMLK